MAWTRFERPPRPLASHPADSSRNPAWSDEASAPWASADVGPTPVTHPEGAVRSEEGGEITRLLGRWQEGDASVAEALADLVYQELRQIATGHLAFEGEDHTLQPTALVHEAFLRLAKIEGVDWRSRKHFYVIASRVIRRHLVDHARRSRALKRGGPTASLPLSEVEDLASQKPDRFLDLDETLERLHELAPLQAQIVELRFFGGFTVEEIAELTGLSTATIQRRWRVARAWLYQELRDYAGVGDETTAGMPR